MSRIIDNLTSIPKVLVTSDCSSVLEMWASIDTFLEIQKDGKDQNTFRDLSS
jgi:hypothetical protein